MYQDTDSMHIDKSKIPELEKSYDTAYEKILPPLLSSGLGGFECDFSFRCGTEGCSSSSSGKCNNVSSVKSFFLGKKMYIDHLRCSVSGKTGYHMRMKGVPSKVLKPEDYEKLYGTLETTKSSIEYQDLPRLFEFGRDVSARGGLNYSRTTTVTGERRVTTT